MTLSIEDAISLHECMERILSDYGDNIKNITSGDVSVEYVLYNSSVKIISVSLAGKESPKAKDKIQEYINNYLDEESSDILD